MNNDKSTRQRTDATEAMPTKKPLLPYFDISNDQYFIKAKQQRYEIV